MIQKYVDRFMENKAQFRATFKEKHPADYAELVKATVKVITSDDYGDLDPERITKIDHGDYQGTLLFTIAAAGYQPRKFWAVKVDYGSCSACDTLQAISNYSSEVTEEHLNQYETLALHIVQGLHEIGGEAA